jgi:hypothetical protein
VADQPGASVSGPLTAGYTIVLPPGWQQIPLQRGTGEAVKKILDGAFSKLGHDLPRDKLTPYRKELERRLAQLITQARRNGGVCLYLPVELMHGTPIPASFVVSEGSLGSAGDIDPALIVSHLAAGDDNGKPVTVNGAMAVRIERTAPPDPPREIEHSSRRVDYVISVPEQQVARGRVLHSRQQGPGRQARQTSRGAVRRDDGNLPLGWAMTTHRRLARSGEMGWLEAHASWAAVSSAFHSFRIVPERSGRSGRCAHRASRTQLERRCQRR